jgi:uncharacterized protein
LEPGFLNKWIPAAIAVAMAMAAPMPALAVIDCSRAQTNTEKLLCSNSRLAEADQRLAFAFREALHRGVNPRELMESQRVWMRDVRDACIEVECMLRAYDERTSELEDTR